MCDDCDFKVVDDLKCIERPRVCGNVMCWVNNKKFAQNCGAGLGSTCNYFIY